MYMSYQMISFNIFTHSTGFSVTEYTYSGDMVVDEFDVNVHGFGNSVDTIRDAESERIPRLVRSHVYISKIPK